MILKVDAACDKGCVRERNEDMILVGNRLLRDGVCSVTASLIESPSFVLALADGMGGHSDGALASEMTLRDLRDFIHQLPNQISENELFSLFKEWIQKMHLKLTQLAVNNPAQPGMGTTLAGVIFHGDIHFLFNVGDSRLYRFRDGVLKQLTVDHSCADLSAGTHRSAAIFNSIGGGGKSVFVDIEGLKDRLFHEDILLLCSDGLSDYLTGEEMQDLLNDGNTSVASFIDAAHSVGAPDNVSIGILQILF